MATVPNPRDRLSLALVCEDERASEGRTFEKSFSSGPRWRHSLFSYTDHKLLLPFMESPSISERTHEGTSVRDAGLRVRAQASAPALVSVKQGKLFGGQGSSEGLSWPGAEMTKN